MKEEKYFLSGDRSGYDDPLYRIAHEIWLAGSVYRADRIDVASMLLVRKGRCDVCLNGKTYVSGSGSVLIYGENDELSVDVSRDMEVYVVCLARGKGDLLQKFGLRQGACYSVSQMGKDLFGVCGQMLLVALSEVRLRQQLCNDYLLVLLRMLENDIAVSDSARDDAADIVDSVCGYIEANLDSLCDVSEIARYSGYSREHLGRLFKRYRGVTTLSYLRQRQMLLARELIRGSGFSLAQVAGYFGFSDAYSFSKVYRRIMGHSPGRERK